MTPCGGKRPHHTFSTGKVDVGDDHLDAAVRESLRDGFAESRAAARYERHFAFESSHVHSLSDVVV